MQPVCMIGGRKGGREGLGTSLGYFFLVVWRMRALTSIVSSSSVAGEGGLWVLEDSGWMRASAVVAGALSFSFTWFWLLEFSDGSVEVFGRTKRFDLGARPLEVAFDRYTDLMRPIVVGLELFHGCRVHIGGW